MPGGNGDDNRDNENNFPAIIIVGSMRMNKSWTYLLAILMSGCVHITAQKSDTQITCRPKFELKPLVELNVIDSEGNQRDAFRQWLILDDGKQQFRIWWASPPLSPAPVGLHTNQAYTFTIEMERKEDVQIPKVIRIQNEKELIYKAKD